MAHQHLCFQSLHGLKCHTNNDDDRRTANAERRVADDDADENRHNCHDCKIQSAKERNLVDNLQNEISRGLARAEAGDERLEESWRRAGPQGRRRSRRRRGFAPPKPSAGRLALRAAGPL